MKSYASKHICQPSSHEKLYGDDLPIERATNGSRKGKRITAALSNKW